MINVCTRIAEWKELQLLSSSNVFLIEKEKNFPHLVLQIHDELLFEVPEEDVSIVKRIIVEEMQSAMILKVPLKVKVKIGKR